MVKYVNRKNKRNKKMPVWKTQKLLRIHGLADSLLRKVGLEDQTIYGGWIEKQRRALYDYESAVLCYLQTSLTSTLKEYQQATAVALQYENTPPTSTGEARKKRRQLDAAQRAMELHQQILSCACSGHSQIVKAFSEANTSAAVYAKATRFSPLEKQIPHFDPTFHSPKEFLAVLTVSLHGEFAVVPNQRF